MSSRDVKHRHFNAFEGHKLAKVELPDSLKTIGKSAFRADLKRASIKEVELGKSLQSIGREAFANQNIKGKGARNSKGCSS